MLFAKNVSGSNLILQAFTLTDFGIEIDMKIANSAGSSLARGQVNIYVLRDNPMKMTQDYATGLDDQFDGIRVTISEGLIKTSGKEAKARAAAVTAVVRDDEY